MKTSWKILLIYTFFVIVWGAFVRASGSGDGCGTHWPSCEGAYLLDNASTAKIIEYTHRATSGIYGIFVLLLSFWTIFSKKTSSLTKSLSAGVLFFTIAEALIGAKLVLSGLVGSNTSIDRAFVMMIHLSNTLILVACNVGVIFCLDYPKLRIKDVLTPSLKAWGPIAILFFLTGSSGAIAALGDTLYPSANLMEGFAMDFSLDSPLIVQLRSLHPIFAFTLTFLVLWFTNPQNNLGLALISVALIALVLGLINLVLLAPVYMQLIHLTVALSFWTLSILYFLNLDIKTKTLQ